MSDFYTITKDELISAFTTWIEYEEESIKDGTLAVGYYESRSKERRASDYAEYLLELLKK